MRHRCHLCRVRPRLSGQNLIPPHTCCTLCLIDGFATTILEIVKAGTETFEGAAHYG
jgi:hypothetical protein